jgi:FkbM family methyltransferase
MKEYFENVLIGQSINRVKIDVGLSYNAPQSQVWLEKQNDLVVFGFEPNPEAIKIISQKNIQKKHPNHGTPVADEYIGTRFFLFPVALADVENPEVMDFYSMENDCGTSSLLKPINSLGTIKSKVKVPVYSLKHFFDLFSWERFEYIEYLKIDAQGFDYNILKSAKNYLKEKVVFITAEPESRQYENADNNNVENITKYLQEQNFLRINHENTSDPTYVNKKYLHLAQDIFIHQNG